MPSDRRRTQRGLALAHALARWAQADRAYRTAAAQRLHVGASDFDALLLLLQDESPWTAGKIADAMGLTTGAVTGLVDRLEKSGWVQRVRDGADRRQVWIERSPTRRQELDAELAIQRAVLAAAAESLDDDALDLAVGVIERAAEHLLEEGVREPAAEEAPAEARGGPPAAAPIGDAKAGVLRIAGGVAHLDLRGSRIKDLFRATFHGRAPVVRVDEGTVQVKYKGFGIFGWSGGDSEITLTSLVPWTIEIRGGVSELRAALGDLHVERIDVLHGASEVDIRLPAPRGTVPVHVVGGASEVTFRRPPKTAVQLVVRGGASAVRLDRRTLESGAGVLRMATDGYDAAVDRYSIEIAGGASEVAVVTETS